MKQINAVQIQFFKLLKILSRVMLIQMIQINFLNYINCTNNSIKIFLILIDKTKVEVQDTVDIIQDLILKVLQPTTPPAVLHKCQMLLQKYKKVISLSKCKQTQQWILLFKESDEYYWIVMKILIAGLGGKRDTLSIKLNLNGDMLTKGLLFR